MRALSWRRSLAPLAMVHRAELPLSGQLRPVRVTAPPTSRSALPGARVTAYPGPRCRRGSGFRAGRVQLTVFGAARAWFFGQLVLDGSQQSPDNTVGIVLYPDVAWKGVVIVRIDEKCVSSEAFQKAAPRRDTIYGPARRKPSEARSGGCPTPRSSRARRSRQKRKRRRSPPGNRPQAHQPGCASWDCPS
jgi:hypothetical protein